MDPVHSTGNVSLLNNPKRNALSSAIAGVESVSGSESPNSASIEAPLWKLSKVEVIDRRLYVDGEQTRALAGIDLRRADLSGAILTNAIIGLENYSFLNNPQQIDLQLNHFNNSSGSLLTTINTIDDQYIDLKINLLHQLIDQLKGVDVSTPIFPRQAFIDAIASNEEYLADDKIYDFMTPLIDHEITAANSAPTLFSAPDNVSAALLRFVKTQCTVADEMLCQANQQHYMIDHNGAFMQLIARYADSENTSLQKIARSLYDHYLALPAVEKIAKNSDFGDMSGNVTPLWNEQDAFNLIFVKDDHALMMWHDILKKMFNNDVEAWNQCYYFANGDNQRQDQVGQRRLFNEIFPVFAHNYHFTEDKVDFQKLFLTLSLGDYHARFTEALTKSYLGEEEKLVDVEHQEKLAAIFNPVMELLAEDAKKTQLREAHVAAIVQVFNLEKSPPSFRQKLYFAWQRFSPSIRLALFLAQKANHLKY